MAVADLGTMASGDRRGRRRDRHVAARHCTRASASSAEPGAAPRWFELSTPRDYDATIAFYRAVFGVDHAHRRATRPSFRYHGRAARKHGPDRRDHGRGRHSCPKASRASWASTSAPRTPTPRWPRSPASGAPSSGPRRTRRTAGWLRQPTRAASTSSSSPRTRRCPRGSPEPRKTRGRRLAAPERRAAARSGGRRPGPEGGGPGPEVPDCLMRERIGATGAAPIRGPSRHADPGAKWQQKPPHTGVFPVKGSSRVAKLTPAAGCCLGAHEK